MTRISTKKFGAVAGGLLAIAATSAGVAQETGGDRYARTLAEADLTARYNVQIEQQVSSQQEEIASLEQQIAALDATAVDVQPLLQRMFDDLVEFVANDVPFFKDERDQRIARIRELMAQRRCLAVGEIPASHGGLPDRDGVWPHHELLQANAHGWP